MNKSLAIGIPHVIFYFLLNILKDRTKQEFVFDDAKDYENEVYDPMGH